MYAYLTQVIGEGRERADIRNRIYIYLYLHIKSLKKISPQITY